MTYTLVFMACTYIFNSFFPKMLLLENNIVERQNGKRGLESGFGSAGYANGI